ncbi:hypothetical protein C4553_00350 [Candidatus Parcubacteria bacterium]|nr:MAG: hypothetical protein C4553_00350 [Candidatus Parcubacteria bacterium]
MDVIQKSTPRDVFLYLFSIVALAISAVAFGTLLFQYINIYFPDPLTDYYRPISSYFSPIRWSLASLVVIFPLYIWVLRFLQKDWVLHPEKRELRIRKWLLYLTLFVASLIIIGDLIALIFNFLEGELTLRFLLKILSIFFIAGSVFFYYLWNLRHEESVFSDSKMRILAWVIILAVIIAVVGGFFVAGSPQNQREVRFDERRIGDLQSIQWQIVNYWQRKGALPQSLDELRDDIGGFVVPRDPQTGEAYEYRILGSLSFELCAEFETSSLEQSGAIYSKRLTPAEPHPFNQFEYWGHSSGNFCFSRTIDPQLYPPLEKSAVPNLPLR